MLKVNNLHKSAGTPDLSQRISDKIGITHLIRVDELLKFGIRTNSIATFDSYLKKPRIGNDTISSVAHIELVGPPFRRCMVPCPAIVSTLISHLTSLCQLACRGERSEFGAK